ncbi:MAG: MarR family transcriptional regulator [Acidobacteriota bacterium]|nr:MarR family transcriptional regulator [Acidobacteriota bacterium]
MQANEHDDELQRLVTDLAKFRYLLRKFLRFSEKAARDAGLTPQQHQLMLGVAGFNGCGTATVSELAEFLQERHHSVVGLIDRAVAKELVQRVVDSSDRRVVRISLTRQGKSILKKLSLVHQAEVGQLRKGLSQFTGGAMSQTAEEQTEALTPES